MGEQLKLSFKESDLTPEENYIWDAIRGRKRCRAIKIWDLSIMLGMNDRRMRQIIRQMRLMGYPIGSSSNRPAGYFDMQTVPDAEETARQFLNRGLKNLRIYWKIEKCTLPDLLGQVKMELEIDAEE